MSDIIFYIFAIITLAGVSISVFASGNKLRLYSLSITLVSISILLTVIFFNSIFISFILLMLVGLLLLFSFTYLKANLIDTNDNAWHNKTVAIICSIFTAILLSIVVSTRWRESITETTSSFFTSSNYILLIGLTSMLFIISIFASYYFYKTTNVSSRT